MAQREDLTGQMFGRLTVLRFSHQNRYKGNYWKVKCSCGEEKAVYSGALKSGSTVSCGCLSREKHLKHGGTRKGKTVSEYYVWWNMKSRCYRKSDNCYANYGGRGIRVCDRWKNDFGAFLEDVGPRPSSRHELDRKDVNGNYEPGNVRWVTKSQQQANTRTPKNNKLGVKGVDMVRGRYRAQMTFNGQKVLNKRFDSLREAAEAYNEAARRYQGEYAWLNDIEALA